MTEAKSTAATRALVFGQLVKSLQNSRTHYRAHSGIAENLAYPVMRQVWRQVSNILAEHSGIVFSPGARNALRKALLARLRFTCRNPAEWTWNVIRGSAAILIESSSKNPKRQLRDIVFANGIEPVVLRMLESYPALARLWSAQTANWIQYITEFGAHAEDFARCHLGFSKRPVLICRIEPDRSDPHSGNRSVMRVCFEGGRDWFYKPRSGKTEEAWFELLRWLNQQHFPTPFAVFKVVSDGDHCWMQAVQHQQCRNKKEVARYYFRAGALLFLIHWLRGVDFHAGNIVAHGAQPVIIDCETLFHPKTKVPRSRKREAASILRTGMLPVRISKSKLSDSISALGRTTFGAHTVRVNGKSVSVSEFVKSVEDGFRTMHSFLLGPSHVSGLTGILSRFREIQYRRLQAPTLTYYRLLEKSYSVAALQSGRARHQALTSRGNRSVPRVMLKEVRALEDADIPLFHGNASALPAYSTKELKRDVKMLRAALLGARTG